MNKDEPGIDRLEIENIWFRLEERKRQERRRRIREAVYMFLVLGGVLAMGLGIVRVVLLLRACG